MAEDEVQTEVDSILSLSNEIIDSIARIHPSNIRPQLGSFPRPAVPDNQRSGYNFSIPLIFDDDHTEWVIKFPLKSRVSTEYMSRKVLSEAATIKWVKGNTSVPCPTIHKFDPDGSAEWNSTIVPASSWTK